MEFIAVCQRYLPSRRGGQTTRERIVRICLALRVRVPTDDGRQIGTVGV